MIPRVYVKLAQTLLNERFGAGLVVDGRFGKVSRWVVLTNLHRNLSSNRGVALVIQSEAKRIALTDSKPDAWWGPVTAEWALTIRVGRGEVERPGKRADEAGKCVVWPVEPGVRCESPSTKAMVKAYGLAGSNQGLVECPFEVALSWDRRKTLTRFSAHESLVSRIERVLGRVQDCYGERIGELGLDRFGGCLNVRKKRGGSTWSTHAWGAAIDWWPEVNKLRETHKTARFAREVYVKWFDLWEEEGFMSLGRCYDFDWMHVQANPK